MQKLLERTFATSSSFAPLVTRFLLGLVVFAHGAQKLFGWFGGYGYSGTMGYFTETMDLPWLVAFLVVILESFGAMLIILGLGTRVMAISYVFLAIGIIYSSHLQNGFYMNWFGNQSGEGYEYFLLWIGIALSLLITGGGAYSLDRFINTKFSAGESS